MAELLIAAHADVNHQEVNGIAALHTAVFHLRHEIVRMLIAAGADVNRANNQGKTPIFFAVKDSPIAQLLIKAGAK